MQLKHLERKCAEPTVKKNKNDKTSAFNIVMLCVASYHDILQ